MLASPELKQTRKDLETKQNEIKEIDSALEALEDDIIETNPKLPRNAILALVARDSKDLIRQKNSLTNQYNAKLGTYKDMKSEIDMEFKISMFEDSQNKAVYKTELDRYNTARSEMREDEKLKFLEDNKKLASQAQFDRQKELAEFNSKLKADNMSG
jgi:hypothetical protein